MSDVCVYEREVIKNGIRNVKETYLRWELLPFFNGEMVEHERFIGASIVPHAVLVIKAL
jgi:hypothetical protein